jgi:hypothetical protein
MVNITAIISSWTLPSPHYRDLFTDLVIIFSIDYAATIQSRRCHGQDENQRQILCFFVICSILLVSNIQSRGSLLADFIVFDSESRPTWRPMVNPDPNQYHEADGEATDEKSTKVLRIF